MCRPFISWCRQKQMDRPIHNHNIWILSSVCQGVENNSRKRLPVVIDSDFFSISEFPSRLLQPGFNSAHCLPTGFACRGAGRFDAKTDFYGSPGGSDMGAAYICWCHRKSRFSILDGRVKRAMATHKSRSRPEVPYGLTVANFKARVRTESYLLRRIHGFR